MIDKRIILPSYSSAGEPLLKMLWPGRMVKCAEEVIPEIRKFIDELPRKKGVTRVLSIAFGVQEGYGPNTNGDGFPISGSPKMGLLTTSPRYGLKTFYTNPAHCFDFHQNRDPGKSYGRVIFAAYNPRMMRVEIVKEIDNDLAQRYGATDYLDALHEGRAVPISMGCRVPWDECTICGNHARIRKEYCACLRNHMLDIYPDGRQAFAVNWLPRFFDISRVRRPADSIAYGLMKVAGIDLSSLSGTDLADLYPVAQEGAKSATMDKEIPAVDTNVDVAPYIETALAERELPREVLDKISVHPIHRILSSTALSGLIPTPREFQYVALKSCGRPSLADHLYESDQVFAPTTGVEDISLDPSTITPSIVRCLLPHLQERTIAEPILSIRVRGTSLGKPESGLPIQFPELGNTYNGFLKAVLQFLGQRLPSSESVPGFESASQGVDLISDKLAGIESVISPLSFGVGSAIYLLTRLAQQQRQSTEDENLLERVTNDPRLSGLLGMAFTRAVASKLLA